MSAPAIVFSGHQNGWNSVSGDGGDYVLDGAWLAVFGDDAMASFTGGDDHVSFYGPSIGFDHETVTGDDGVIVGTHADIALTGDNDIVFFDDSPDVFDLTAATPGAWSALYASNVFVNLHGASLSIVGGGVTIDAIAGQGDDAVSLYQTDGAADLVIGDDVIVTLNNAQAVVQGSDDSIWFEGGSGSTVTVNSAPGAPDTVYGAGVIDVASGAVNAVGGGALIDFQAPGEVANISYTQGFWDRVEGAAGQINIYDAQVSVFGGNQTVNILGGSDDQLSLYQTNGAWDSVYTNPASGAFYGVSNAVIVNSAQVNFFGAPFTETIYLDGVGDQLSFYAEGFSNYFTVVGSAADLVLNATEVLVENGGNNTLFFNPAYHNVGDIINTLGMWDTVYATGGAQDLLLSNAQVSVIGGVAAYGESNTFNAVSFYNANEAVDSYTGAGEVILNNSTVNVSGGGDVFSFTGAANTLNVSGGGDAFNLAGQIGMDSINGFASGDVINLLHSQFADFAAVQAALSQQGANTALTLNSTDKATFVGVSLASFTAATFQFV